MIVTTNAARSLSLRRRGNSGADRITRAGNPTARQFGGIAPDTTEFAPMTVPSPIVVPGITETRQGSHTLLPSVTGSYDTGYPSNALSHTPWVKIRQWPPRPGASPMVTGLVGLMNASCRMVVRLANTKSGTRRLGT